MSIDAGTPTTLRFGPLTIAYDDRVLVPREWTTLQSHWAQELLASAPEGPVLELCSGVGHIGLLAVDGTDRLLVCVDQNPVACDFARQNARAAGREELVDVRNIALQSLAEDEAFPLIIADPPWVSSDDVHRFPEDPVLAIDGGSDGLALARACVTVIDGHLHERGAALVQLGSVEQARQLGSDLPPSLVLGEVREHADGVVALLTRPGSR